MRRLSLADTTRLRSRPGHTVLLYITDRCPVGCGHCSVDSRPDSPTVTDWPRFEAVVAGIAALPVEVVAISGGEPFVERRALPAAVRTLRAAGKDIVLFTSGYWAPTDRAPAQWIRGVLRETATVFLSTDAFHDESVPRERFAAALRHTAAAGCHIVVQVLDRSPDADIAQAGIRAAFGSTPPSTVELSIIQPLDRGRGAGLFQIGRRHPASAFGACGLLGSPTVRYDGTILPCCNESLIVGGGPAGLRRTADSAPAVGEALADLHRDPLLRLVGTAGPGALAALPGYARLAAGRYTDVCGACWTAYEARAADPTAAAVAELVATSGGKHP
jgi:hypothetical protein